MGYLLGVDVGSSSTKVGLFGLDGHAVAVSSRSYPTEEPKPGFKEQNPELWWEAVVSAIRDATKDADTGSLLAIGSTGHICSHTFVDAGGKVIRPSLGFQDLRAVTEVEELLSKTSREELALELGVDLPPAANWPLPRLLWFRKMEPATLASARYLIPLLSRNCGSIPVPEADPRCDKGRFPWHRRCENRKNVWSPHEVCC